MRQTLVLIDDPLGRVQLAERTLRFVSVHGGHSTRIARIVLEILFVVQPQVAEHEQMLAIALVQVQIRIAKLNFQIFELCVLHRLLVERSDLTILLCSPAPDRSARFFVDKRIKFEKRNSLMIHEARKNNR